MFTDNHHKGLAIYRAARAERREIAVLAKEIAVSNPDKTPKELKQIAIEIRAARQQKAETERCEAKQHTNHIKHKNKNKPKCKPEVIVFNRI